MRWLGRRGRFSHEIELLLQLRDLLDGDPDQEPERHDGAASFPSSPLYAISDPLATDGGAGAPEDAEVDDEPEDSDVDEPSYIWVTDRSGRERMA
jgi:hypothetical protein